MRTAILLALCSASLTFAQSAGDTYDRSLKGPESEVVSLAEAMPESALNFVPKGDAFATSRTFAQQVKHIAYVNYMVAAALLGEKNPSETGKNENGPNDVVTKAQVVKYLKDSFAYCHKAMATITNANVMEPVPDAFDAKRKTPRLAQANVILWHTFDHYGQMVIYSRLNNVVPPASR